MLPPTSETLRLDATRPYFLWWTAEELRTYRDTLAARMRRIAAGG